MDSNSLKKNMYIYIYLDAPVDELYVASTCFSFIPTLRSGAYPGFLRGAQMWNYVSQILERNGDQLWRNEHKRWGGGGAHQKSASPHSYMQAPLNVFFKVGGGG